jgi:outer membrane lipoprotein-sorting protein
MYLEEDNMVGKRRIKKYYPGIVYSISVLLMLHCAAVVPALDNLSDILDGIRKKYASIPGFVVSYQREIITSSMALLGDSVKTDLAAGRLYFRPPRFLKVQQETPTPETLTTDGNTLWWYIPQEKRVYQSPADRLGKELHLLSDIFQGLRQVEESFDIIQSGLDEKGDLQLTLIPNPPWEEIDNIILSVDRSDFHIRIVEIHNTLGDTTRFLLGDLSVQDQLKEEFFRFVAPDGVQVILEDG